MSGGTKVAIVTGASQGLGRVIAGVLAGRGVDLVVGARDARQLGEVSEALAVGGARIVPVAGAVEDPDVRRRLVDAALALGGIDLLVNNASALGPIRPLREFDVAGFKELVMVNVSAPLALMQLATPHIAARHGLIVNITSDAAAGAYPGWGPYGATKAALELISRTWAAEEAPTGVHTVVVDPGDMRTAMHQAAFPGEDISDRPLPDVTVPFWNWLFEQPPSDLNGQRFAAQTRDARWLQPA
jgi:NAD(P)-dependent dehydrogenase (short-subunit alcohol dehydrogenase family)